MPAHTTPSSRPHEAGQLFGGWIVGIFIIAALVVYAEDTLRRSRNNTESTVYRELALNIAKAGFEEGLSFFRTHTNGCYLNSSQAPTSQSWVTPWPTYPDAAFLPQSVNTDFYTSISFTSSLGATAGGMIGDVSMDQYVTYTGSTEMRGSTLWGRYVIRRQNIQNWSPGPDTASANTDPDACHDISAISAQSPLGSGTRWSIVSRGYLLRLPSPVTSTSYTSSLLGTPAAFASKNLLSAPLTYYNNQPFLLAQARVYGELARINFNVPSSAVMIPYVSTTNTLLINTNGIVNGGTASTYTSSSSSQQTPGGDGGGQWSGVTNLNDTTQTAAIGNCFPGQTWGTLQKIAISLEPAGGQITGYVGGASVLPVFNSGTFQAQVNQPAFYFLNQSITLSSSTTSGYVLSGVGLCVIEGSLDIPAGNNSNWAGVLYVQGQVTLDGPTSITGILISQTGITIGNASDLNKTNVSYDSGVISLVQGLLQNFTVDSSSIVANSF